MSPIRTIAAALVLLAGVNVCALTTAAPESSNDSNQAHISSQQATTVVAQNHQGRGRGDDNRRGVARQDNDAPRRGGFQRTENNRDDNRRGVAREDNDTPRRGDFQRSQNNRNQYRGERRQTVTRQPPQRGWSDTRNYRRNLERHYRQYGLDDLLNFYFTLNFVPNYPVWVNASRGRVPYGAQVMGYDRYIPYYRCRAWRFGRLSYGRLYPRRGCYINQGFFRYRANQYQVLVD